MKQEELNTRLNALLDKFAKEEMEFLKAISEFDQLVKEYNSNLMRVFFDTARNHFIDLLDGLRNIKKAVFAPTGVFRIKSEDFFDLIVDNLPEVEIPMKSNDYDGCVEYQISIINFIRINYFIHVKLKFKTFSFPANIFQKGMVLESNAKVYCVDLSTDQGNIIMLNCLQNKILKEYIEQNTSLKMPKGYSLL